MVSSNGILVSLAKVAKLFYDKMLQKLDSGDYPKGDGTRNPPTFSIQRATFVESPKTEGNTFSVKIKISLSKAPYALAFEKGSGVHGEGGGSEYPIEPKEKLGSLVFPVSRWPQWEDWKGAGVVPYKGKFILLRVLHPGIEKRPYIRPTIVSINEEVKGILAKDFKAELLKGEKKIEVIK